MAINQALLKSARLFHLYSGVFLTPALLFFAFTGGVQTFSLHETTRGSSYKPPAILVELGQLHKKQTLVVPVRKNPPGEARPEAKTETKAGSSSTSEDHTPGTHSGDRHDSRPDRRSSDNPAAGAAPATPPPAATPAPSTPAPSTPARVHNLLPMKIFFLIVSIGLFFSTLTGLYMAYKYARRKSTITLTLLAGVVIPLLLLLF